MNATGMIIDGLATTSAIDSSGESLSVEGADISTLAATGCLNYEHIQSGEKDKTGFGLEKVGRVLYARKLLKEDDCLTDRQRMYWKKLGGLEAIYVIGRLYDGAGHKGAVALAAALRDHHANNENQILQFSIEGSTLQRSGQLLEETICRDIALTWKACNKSCDIGILLDPNAPDGFDKEPVPAKEVEKMLDLTKSEMLIHAAKVRVRALLKSAWTAGSPGAAPGTLTDGAAVQREALGAQRKKAVQTFENYRAPFKKDEFRRALKHELPEASDEFIDHFSDLAEEISVKRGTLRKSMADAVLVKTTTRSGEFQRWFEGSKMVDDNGQPRRLYHGTRSSSQIRGLRPSPGGEFGPGIYLAPRPETADMYASNVASGPDGPSIVPVHASLRNPFRVSKVDWIRMTHHRTPSTVQRRLIARGHDGIIGVGLNGDEQIVAFAPEQVKSVFNPMPGADPDLHKSHATPNPHLAAPFFDETTATLHSPFGSWPACLRDPGLVAKINHPDVQRFFSRVMQGWAQVNGLLRSGRAPMALIRLAASGKDAVLRLTDLAHTRRDDARQLLPQERAAMQLLGASTAVALDASVLVADLFGFGLLDHDAKDRAYRDLLPAAANDAFSRAYARQHCAALAVQAGPHGALLRGPDDAALPGTMLHWLAVMSDSNRPLWKEPNPFWIDAGPHSAQRAAAATKQHQAWQASYGNVGALILHFAWAVPWLLGAMESS